MKAVFAAIVTVLALPSMAHSEQSQPSQQSQQSTANTRVPDAPKILRGWAIASQTIAGRQVAVIADLPEPATYRICRDKSDGVATATSELYVYVDDVPLRSTGTIPSTIKTPYNNFSLDQDSCVVAFGKKFSLKYSGPGGVAVGNVLSGYYERLRGNLTTQEFNQLSYWSMNWVKGSIQFHDTVLVNQIAGVYRVCVAYTETLPTGSGQAFVGVEVDGKLVSFAGGEYAFRTGCVDVSGQKIVMRQLAFPIGVEGFRVFGSLNVLLP